MSDIFPSYALQFSEDGQKWLQGSIGQYQRRRCQDFYLLVILKRLDHCLTSLKNRRGRGGELSLIFLAFLRRLIRSLDFFRSLPGGIGVREKCYKTHTGTCARNQTKVVVSIQYEPQMFVTSDGYFRTESVLVSPTHSLYSFILKLNRYMKIHPASILSHLSHSFTQETVEKHFV